jgi:hypothetical protein
VVRAAVKVFRQRDDDAPIGWTLLVPLCREHHGVRRALAASIARDNAKRFKKGQRGIKAKATV